VKRWSTVLRVCSSRLRRKWDSDSGFQGPSRGLHPDDESTIATLLRVAVARSERCARGVAKEGGPLAKQAAKIFAESLKWLGGAVPSESARAKSLMTSPYTFCRP